MPLDDEAHLQGLQHVEGVAVGAHAHQDVLGHHLADGGAAHGVAHVALGVVADHGLRVPDDVHLAAVHVDAVAQHGFSPQNAVVEEPVHGPGAVVQGGVVHVVQPLGHVDMVARAAVVGLLHLLEGPVRDGEQGVAAEHGGDHGIGVLLAVGDEAGVLLDGLVALLLPVPLGHLVAEAGPDAQLPGHLLDLEEGAGDGLVAGVMVEDGGTAGLDAVDDGGVGAGPGTRERQVPVDSPPHAVQDLIKVGGVETLDGQAPGEGAVDMGVDVDERGHDDAAPGVHTLGVGPGFLQLSARADGLDVSPIHQHGPVREVGTVRVPGDDFSVGDQDHGLPPSNLIFIKRARVKHKV